MTYIFYHNKNNDIYPACRFNDVNKLLNIIPMFLKDYNKIEQICHDNILAAIVDNTSWLKDEDNKLYPEISREQFISSGASKRIIPLNTKSIDFISTIEPDVVNNLWLIYNEKSIMKHNYIFKNDDYIGIMGTTNLSDIFLTTYYV